MRCSSALRVFAPLTLGLLVPTAAAAQQPDPDDRDALYYAYLDYGSLIEGGSVTPHWLADGSGFWYAEGGPDSVEVLRVDPATDQVTPFFDTRRLREAVSTALGRDAPGRGIPFRTFEVENGGTIRFTLEDREYRLDPSRYEVEALPVPTARERERSTPRVIREGFPSTGPDQLEQRSPDGRWLLGVEASNLYLRSTYDGRTQALTEDGTEEFPWSARGAPWSPDGRAVAVFRTDMSGVAPVPLVQWLKPREAVEWYPFVKAGGWMPRTHLYVIDVLSRTPVTIDLGPAEDHYVNVVRWFPDGSRILVTRADRTMQHMELLTVDPATGETRSILEESSETFIGNIAGTGPLGLTLLEDADRFLWISERDGWRHLYLYDMGGRLIRQLTDGDWPVGDVVAVDEEDGWVFFTGHDDQDRPYDTHLYRVGLESGSPEPLTEATGQHSPVVSPSREYFVDTHSTVDRPPVVELRQTDGTLVRVLSEADVSALEEQLHWRPGEEVVTVAADGETELWGVLFKPHDFDPNRRYPVIDYLYNGPQTTWVPRTFVDGRAAWSYAMAQLGFVVFMVDGRGTPERSKAFQDVVYRNFGRNEIPDHRAALEAVAETRPYLDLERVGLRGGSWGGYMTIRGLVLEPDFYKVGVSTAPVVEMFDHASAAIERYMSLPEDNPEGYAYGSSLRLADRLEGKLLLMHGTHDVNATFSATMKMVEALTRAGKRYDLVVLPEENHWFQGVSLEYANEARRRYFEEHLLNRETPTHIVSSASRDR